MADLGDPPGSPSKAIVLDASAVIAHLAAGDPHHAAATRLLSDHATARLFVHSVNLAEVLVGGVRAGRGREMLDDLTSLGVNVAEPVADEPLRLAELRIETGLKLPDCCALVVAATRRLPLASFDDRLRRAATAIGLPALPPSVQESPKS